MPRIKAPKSKRKSSKQRHKIERKKREHKRDLRKAAKALKDKGLGPQRSKKAAGLAKLALQVSNTHPDKEVILNSVLKARENVRVEKLERRKRMRENDFDDEEMDKHQLTPVVRGYRQLLYIPARDSNNFRVQFLRSLNELVFPVKSSCEGIDEIPSVAYLITLDCRFSVQCLPWTLLDAIIQQEKLYEGSRRILLLFTITKVDLVSISALISQISLVGHAVYNHYGESLGKNIVATIAPFSSQHDKTGRHILRILKQFSVVEGGKPSKNSSSNLNGKICTFVVGLPNTGRRTLCRSLTTGVHEGTASSVPFRATQLQIRKVDDSDEVEVKLAVPNAKYITFLTFPEDTGIRSDLKNASGADIVFRSQLYVEKLQEPEVVGCALFSAVLDKKALAQAFCQAEVVVRKNEELSAAKKFLCDLGKTVRQEKGFHISPLFVPLSGTMGQQTSSHLSGNVTFTSGQKRSQETLLDATYSGAMPSKLIRVSSVITVRKGGHNSVKAVERMDGKNVLRLGARTFVRELCQSRHVPWAVMRAPFKVAVKPEEIGFASLLFDLSLARGLKPSPLTSPSPGVVVATSKGVDHLNELIQSICHILKDVAIFFPNGVVEFDPDCIVPPQYDLTVVEKEEGEHTNNESEGCEEVELRSNETNSESEEESEEMEEGSGEEESEAEEEDDSSTE